MIECLVTGKTTCARNSTFVKWQDGSLMFGVRFAKEDQAEQVFLTKASKDKEALLQLAFIA